MRATAARLTAVTAAAAFAVSAGAASARTEGIGFSFLPQHAVQGTATHISVNVKPAGVRCTLTVRYHNGAAQAGLAPAMASGGHATWAWSVPTNVQAGVAKATVRCGSAGTVTRSLVIVGRLAAPKVDVKRQGFSIRPNPGGVGNRLSYGVVLHNEATRNDALNVIVQVNFVMADDHLLGTDTQHITGIAAGSDYALGNTVTFQGAAPISRLEVVIQVGGLGPPTLHYPTLANMHFVPSFADTRWVGTVEGELQNTDPTMTLRSAQLSCVVFDGAGNVIGGGSGFALQTLPPGAREFLKLTNGFDVIPIDRASTFEISMTPSWQPPGT